VLGGDACDVSVMVLHGDPRQVERQRELGREVLGVQVVSDERRLDPEQALVQVERVVEVFEGGRVLHVADVLGYERLRTGEQGERVLLFGAHGEDGRCRCRRAA
jgi:hypothetical protein